MATYNKIQDFVEQLGLAVHNLNTHTIKAALNRSDAAAGAGSAVTATDTQLADIVQPTGTGYKAGGGDTQNNVEKRPPRESSPERPVGFALVRCRRSRDAVTTTRCRTDLRESAAYDR